MLIIAFCPFTGEIVLRTSLPPESAFSFSHFSILVKVVRMGRKEFLRTCSHDVILLMAEEQRRQLSPKRRACRLELFANVTHYGANVGLAFNAGVLSSLQTMPSYAIYKIFALETSKYDVCRSWHPISMDAKGAD